MKKMTLTIDNQEVEVLAQKINGKLWFHYQGETYEYVPQSHQSQSSNAGASQDPTKIVAPMPGKIIKVLGVVGQPAAEGETLVVMEAMKMEYNLKATQDMKVRSIPCQEGAQVALGDILVELEE